MRIARYTDPHFAAMTVGLHRRPDTDPKIRRTVARIIAETRRDGEAALHRFNARFGGPGQGVAPLRVDAAEFAAAARRLDARTERAMAEAHENVRAFALKSLCHDWTMHNRQGVEVGERFDPFPRVGIYVPGGTAPLVSTAIMTCTLAQAAGVPEIVVTTPADREGKIAPALLAALQLAGATEVYRVGGAQAIAALAHGILASEQAGWTVRPVTKIFGPGNAYVVEAKRQVFGRVAIDQLPGPSEILVIADDTANPEWIAADLLAQAEHGAQSVIGFFTDSPTLLAAVPAAVTRQLASLNRQSHLGPVLEQNAWGCLVENLDHAAALANAFAPEHLSICTADPDALAAKIHTAGAIFLGGWSPVAGGDFLAGPSHTLPTGGAGKSFAGLTVDQFQRRTSMVRFDEASLRRSVPSIQTFSDLEGLDAHGRSATIRFDTSNSERNIP